MEECKIVPIQEKDCAKKFWCETHSQSLLYLYLIDGIVFVRCQVGEDKHEPIQALHNSM